MKSLPFYARATFLNAVEGRLTREEDAVLLRGARQRILDLSSEVQNNRQMTAIIAYAMDPYFLVEEQISPTDLAALERREARVCRAAEAIEILMDSDLSADIDAEQDEPQSWGDHYAAFPTAHMAVVLGGAI